MIPNMTTGQTDDQDITHNNSTNRRSGYNTLQQYNSTNDQDTKHTNSTNRRSGYKKIQQDKQTIRIQNITTV